MSIDETFVKQAKDKIREWNQELIELEARLKQGVESPEQTQVCQQRIIELKSQVATAQNQIEKAQSS